MLASLNSFFSDRRNDGLHDQGRIFDIAAERYLPAGVSECDGSFSSASRMVSVS